MGLVTITFELPSSCCDDEPLGLGGAGERIILARLAEGFGDGGSRVRLRGVPLEAAGFNNRCLDVAGTAAAFKEAGVGRERIAEAEENGKLLDSGVCFDRKLASANLTIVVTYA